VKENFTILRQDDRYPIPKDSLRTYVFPVPIKVFCEEKEAIKLAEYLCSPGMDYEYYVYEIERKEYNG